MSSRTVGDAQRNPVLNCPLNKKQKKKAKTKTKPNQNNSKQNHKKPKHLIFYIT